MFDHDFDLFYIIKFVIEYVNNDTVRICRDENPQQSWPTRVHVSLQISGAWEPCLMRQAIRPKSSYFIDATPDDETKYYRNI